MWETMEKFSLEHCDLPTMLRNVEVLMRIVGVKIQRNAKSIPKITYMYLISVLLIYFFNYYVSTTAYVLVICRESGDFLAAALVASISFNSLLGVNKLMYTYKYLKKVQSLVAGYLAYDRLPLNTSGTSLMTATTRTVKKRFLLSLIITGVNDVVYNLQPLLYLVVPLEVNMYDTNVVFGLKYFFGISNYPLAVFIIFTCSSFIGYVVAVIPGLLIITTGYSEARLLGHSQELRNLWSDALKYYRENFDESYTGENIDLKATKELNKYIKHRLHLIVESHVINISLIRQVEVIFRNSIFVEFALHVGGILTNLLGGFKKCFIMLPFSMLQVVLDCYVGQKLIDANNIFEEAVYDCKWENFDGNNRKTVLLILEMSQKTLILSAGSLATLSFESFMALYKTVYSAYAGLNSTVG